MNYDILAQHVYRIQTLLFKWFLKYLNKYEVSHLVTYGINIVSFRYVFANRFINKK